MFWSISAARCFVSLSGSQGVCNSGDFFGPPCGCCPIFVESRLRYFVVENCCNGLSRPWQSNFTCSFYSAVFFVERTTCDDCNCLFRAVQHIFFYLPCIWLNSGKIYFEAFVTSLVSYMGPSSSYNGNCLLGEFTNTYVDVDVGKKSFADCYK